MYICIHALTCLCSARTHVRTHVILHTHPLVRAHTHTRTHAHTRTHTANTDISSEVAAAAGGKAGGTDMCILVFYIVCFTVFCTSTRVLYSTIYFSLYSVHLRLFSVHLHVFYAVFCTSVTAFCLSISLSRSRSLSWALSLAHSLSLSAFVLCERAHASVCICRSRELIYMH